MHSFILASEADTRTPLLAPACCRCCCCFTLPLPAGFWPLDPVLQTQPARVDIYPGLSGPLRAPLTNATWNSYVLIAPDNDTLQYMYDLGRADAAAWVTANLGNVARFNATAVSSALTSTALRVAA